MIQRLSLLIGALALLAGLAAPATSSAQTAPVATPKIQVVHRPCAAGARVAVGSSCIYGKVFRANGQQPGSSKAGQEVTLEYVDATGARRLLRTTTRQRPGDPVGEAGFAFILPPDVRPVSTTLTLQAQAGGQGDTRRVPLLPDPISLSQEVNLFLAAKAPPLFGRVFSPNDGSPIAASVTLSYTVGGVEKALSVATADDAIVGQQIFAFAPKKLGIGANTRITLTARSATSPPREQQVTTRWEAVPLLVDLYPGWNCDYGIPKSGGRGLPESFCLSGTVVESGDLLAAGQGSVIVSVGSLSLSTATITPTLGTNFALDIGPLLADQPPTATLRISAVGIHGSASESFPVGELLSRPDRSQRVGLNLRPEWLAGDGPRGQGTVLASATTTWKEHALEAVIIRGGGVFIKANSDWLSRGPFQPCREGAALAFQPLGAALALDCSDHTGQAYRSFDLGKTWEALGAPPTAGAAPNPAVALGAATITAILSDTTPLAGTPAEIAADASFGRIFTPTQPLSNLKDLASCGGAQLALGAQALWKRDGGEGTPWRQLSAGIPTAGLNGRSLVVAGNRVVIGRSTSQAQTLISADCGESWQTISLPQASPVTDLAAGGDTIFAATDGAGVWQLAAGATVWQEFNGQLPADARRVSALAAANGTLYAATNGADRRVFTSALSAPGGNWIGGDAPPGLITQLTGAPTRPDVLFAAGSQGLFKRIGTGSWQQKGASAGPLRLLALAAPQSYAADRLVMVGGTGTGMLYYNDNAPEVTVDLAIRPAQLRPGEALSATLTVRNIGGSTARDIKASLAAAAPLQVDPNAALSAATLAVGDILTQTIVITALNSSAFVPGNEALIRASVSADEDESAGNNTAQASVLLNPLRGIDVSALLAQQGTLQTGPTPKATLMLGYDNLGEEATQALTLTVSGPPTVSVDIDGTPRPLPFRLPLPALAGGETPRGAGLHDCRTDNCTLPVKLRFPATISDGETISITASISAQGPGGSADRDLGNNSDTLGLVVGGKPATTLFVVNYGRLGTLATHVREQLARVRANSEVNGVELRLDTSNNVAAGWQAVDAALGEGNLPRAAAKAQDLVNSIRTLIADARKRNPAITSIVLVGGDRVIPYGIVPEDVRLSADQLAEQAMAADGRIPRSTPLYAVLSQNYYPSDEVYGTKPAEDTGDPQRVQRLADPGLTVARLVETPQQIADYLEHVADSPAGTALQLRLDNPGVIGYAPEVTRDQFEQSCQQFHLTFSSERCRPTVSPTDRLGLSFAILGGHGDPFRVDQIGAEVLRANVLSATTPFALTVSCHAGLSIPIVPNQPPLLSLPAAASGGHPDGLGGGAYIGSLGYAYGAIGNPATDYNEELALTLQDLALDKNNHGDLTVGEVFRKAKERYVAARPQGRMTALDWKVVRGLALYGLPMLRIQPSPAHTSALPMQAAGLSAIAGTQLYTQALTLPLSPTIQPDPMGPGWSSGVADYSTASAVQQGSPSGEEGTRQPYLQQTLGPLSDPVSGQQLVPKGVLFGASEYTTLETFDPAIVSGLALSADSIPQERPNRIGGWEDARVLSAVPLSDSQLLLRLWLGQYRRSGTVSRERLLQNPQLTVIYGPPSPDTQPPKPEVAVCRPTPRLLRVSQPKRDTVLAFVTFTTADGRWRTLPMTAQGSRFVATVPSSDALEIFVQSVDAAGNVAIGLPQAGFPHSFFRAASASCADSSLLRVSSSSARTADKPLADAVVSGSMYAFIDATDIDQVHFWLDDPQRQGKPNFVEYHRPYDFMGARYNIANPYDTRRLANGKHTITAEVGLTNGTTRVISATFRVRN